MNYARPFIGIQLTPQRGSITFDQGPWGNKLRFKKARAAHHLIRSCARKQQEMLMSRRTEWQRQRTEPSCKVGYFFINFLVKAYVWLWIVHIGLILASRFCMHHGQGSVNCAWYHALWQDCSHKSNLSNEPSTSFQCHPWKNKAKRNGLSYEWSIKDEEALVR